ncbi:MAG: hypothetical protein GY878_22735 [Fuerstiella sp.]|nr:hypothetical protein [Fuerstiella sp.]
MKDVKLIKLRRAMVALVAAMWFCTAALLAEARTWTDTRGRKLEADLVEVLEGSVRLKRKSDGRVITVPLRQLSIPDRKYVAAQKSASKQRRGPAVKPLGKLDAFWRYAPALGPFHEGGQSMIEIPDYVTKGDFAYKKKPYDRETPFADHLTMVRFLGGFNDSKNPALRQLDLASRNSDGTIQYHWELIKPRLRPYLDSGYRDFTIVLDNVPWCFPAHPETENLGQKSPPRDSQEWHDFIVALCRELEKILGKDEANRLRFRVGTENNGRERFDGPHEEYVRHYMASAAAVKSVLPDAEIGPFNIAGVSIRGLDELHNVRAYDLVNSCLKKTNPFSGKVGTPVDFIAYSRYYQADDDITADAHQAGDAWKEFEKRFPQVKGISREIHEFGIAPFGNKARGDFVSQEPGALGAAATALMMFRLREEGVNRIFHWGVTDPFRDGKNVLHNVFTGYGWLLSVLERGVGGESYVIHPISQSAAGAEYPVLVSVKPDETLFVFTAYNQNTANHTTEDTVFRIPKTVIDLEGKSIQCVVLDRGTSVHDRIRKDLADAGLLTARFVERPDRNGGIREIGKGGQGGPCEKFVGERLETYHQAWQDSLTLRPMPESMGSVTILSRTQEVKLRLAAPQLVVLVVR